jgi:hypothetical protein
VKTLATVASAIVLSSFTLWLVESWIRYPLFLFNILAIIVLHLISSGYNIKTTTRLTRVGKFDIGLAGDILLVASALSLLTFNALQIPDGLAQLFLALICTSLLSGYSILSIFGLARYFSKLEKLVVSFILSYAFTAFITLVSLSMNHDTRYIVIIGSFIILGLISIIRRKSIESSSGPRSFSKNIDFLALLVAVALYIMSFCFMYPECSLIPGTDISRHYRSSITLARTPDIYVGSTYLFSHLHESTYLLISNTSLASAQTGLVALNLILPFAFYIMAKTYLEKIDPRLPSMSTMFWVLFTNSFGGFAWIHFAFLKLSTTGQT